MLIAIYDARSNYNREGPPRIAARMYWCWWLGCRKFEVHADMTAQERGPLLLEASICVQYREGMAALGALKF